MLHHCSKKKEEKKQEEKKKNSENSIVSKNPPFVQVLMVKIEEMTQVKVLEIWRAIMNKRGQ